SQWRDAYASMLVDLARLTVARQEQHASDISHLAPRGGPDDVISVPRHPGALFATIGSRRDHPTTRVRERLLRFLRHQTGQRFGDDLDRWRAWTWSLAADPHPEYLAFKEELYGRIEPATAAFFASPAELAIRLDEIEWTRLGPNEVPPLHAPPHVGAGEARHMRDGHRVFGLVRNGEARAYPARILASHQVAHDRLGGHDVLVVHCPLSGVITAYHPADAGQPLTFGASGLVYRSQGLLFDRQTRSLWSPMTGERLVGGPATPLRRLPIVVTSWGAWRREHPGTTVLSPDTGHRFTYVEGAITRARLRRVGVAFPVPPVVPELDGDAEILGVPPLVSAGRGRPMAVPARSLGPGAVRAMATDAARLVIVTGRQGLARVYDAGEVEFGRLERDGQLQDQAGRPWRIEEDALVLVSDQASRAPRVPAVWAAWAAWHARFPDTVLVR
ncbi:MAG: DUF3179 domain-containing (seleno)protein, partial [Acidobacteriota bacterium]